MSCVVCRARATEGTRVVGQEESEWDMDLTDLEEEAQRLTTYINDAMWDDHAGFYYDRRYNTHTRACRVLCVAWRVSCRVCLTSERRLSDLTGHEGAGLSSVKTIGAYWALLAGVVPPERLARFVGHLDDEAEFKTPRRVPSLSRDHPHFSEYGHYWLGSVWPPTNYMVRFHPRVSCRVVSCRATHELTSIVCAGAARPHEERAGRPGLRHRGQPPRDGGRGLSGEWHRLGELQPRTRRSRRPRTRVTPSPPHRHAPHNRTRLHHRTHAPPHTHAHAGILWAGAAWVRLPSSSST